jgi:hypothetical protein
MSEPAGPGYSAIADQQLDELQVSGDSGLYAAVVETCELILDHPGVARRRSAAIRTPYGIRFRTPVNGFPDVKVFWSSEGPRIGGVFPYPT